MNVLVCFEHHFIQCGGQYYSRQLSPAFMQRYREVWDRVLVLARLSRQSEPPAGVAPLHCDDLHFIALPDYLGLREFLKCRGEIRTITRSALEQAESVILRAPGVISTVAWSMIRNGPRPYGMEVIGDPLEGFAKGAVRHPLRPLIRWKLARDLRNQCHGASATAYVTKRTLQNQYPPAPGRFTTSYSDVELDAQSLLPEAREFVSAPALPRMVMVGTFSQMYKGHDIILQALALLKARNVPFEIAFAGDGKHRVEMENLATTLGIAEHTKFLGELNAGADVQRQLDLADLFVMPSRTEGLPRALIEAMARGLPCIASAVGGIPELLAPDDLVPPSQPVQLAEKLIAVLQNPRRMQSMSARNLETAAGYVNTVSAARRLEFYRALRTETKGWLDKNRPTQVRSPQATSTAKL
jgi:glycosyltransferase involved in cell wall biosynthesis